MAKFKPAGQKKTKPANLRGALPCMVLVVLVIVSMCLLFYFSLQSNNP